METRKTTITLPEHLWEALRIRAARERTTMSALIAEAVEALESAQARRPSEPSWLAEFFDASPEATQRWRVESGDEAEDFDDTDID